MLYLGSQSYLQSLQQQDSSHLKSRSANNHPRSTPQHTSCWRGRWLLSQGCTSSSRNAYSQSHHPSPTLPETARGNYLSNRHATPLEFPNPFMRAPTSCSALISAPSIINSFSYHISCIVARGTHRHRLSNVNLLMP